MPPPEANAPRPWWLSVAGHASTRELAQLGLGVAATLGYQANPWLGFGAQLRGQNAIRSAPLGVDRSLVMRSSALSLLACARTPTERLYGGACLGPELSLAFARGVGFPTSDSARLLMWGAVLRVEAGVALTKHWTLLSYGFLRLNFEQKQFVVEPAPETNEAFGFSRWAPGVGLGVVYQFGSGNLSTVATH